MTEVLEELVDEKVDDKIEHNCGLCVAHTLHDAYSFIKSLQHRGREATGIAFIGNGRIDVIKWAGNVERFDLEDLYKIFPSPHYHTYMVHVRYATRGRKDKILEDAHPHTIGGKTENRGNHIIVADCEIAGVHNGQVNVKSLKIDASKLKTECDTEVLLQFYKEKGEIELLEQIPGAYTLAVADKKRSEVLVLRDKHGIKPGVLGWKDGKYVVASEDIALMKNGGRFIEELEPGAVYYLDGNGNYRREKVVESNPRHCFFEYNYIAHADSHLEGVSIERLRECLGEALKTNFKSDSAFVTFLPRCPEPAARKYAESTGLPFKYVFYKPRAERAFQGSTSDDRQKSIAENLYVILPTNASSRLDLNGKNAIVIDDSTIRGNNSRIAIKLLKDEGVNKIYLINYTPKIGIIGADGIPRGCLYGVDMPPDDNFIVRRVRKEVVNSEERVVEMRNRTDEEINQALGVEVYFLSREEMLKAFEKAGMPSCNLCTFCIGGEKPF